MNSTTKRPSSSRVVVATQTSETTDGTSHAGQRRGKPWKAVTLPTELRPRGKRPARAHIVKACELCGGAFYARLDHLKQGNARFCSRSCGTKATRNIRMPVIDKPWREKIRANGLINMRIRRGLMEKPSACQACGAAKKLDGHHADYDKPGEVLWLCRSCHMKAHFGTLKMPEVA